MIEHTNKTFHFGILFFLLWIKNGIRRNRKFTNELIKHIEAGLFALVFDSIYVSFANAYFSS